ncbi:MAG: class I SAM-dependent methyltransferase [Aureispira sp.]|nr:class I SAM-dependent methyltransferase [Aureispira sp.]
MKHIRKLYEQLGVDKYYRQYGDEYQNPHVGQVQELLVNNEKHIDYSQVLDFCAGGGEVSWILKELSYTSITGSDPFTHKLYTKNLGQPCAKWTFDDVIKGKLKGQYSAIVCSFAMHLCPPERLYPLMLQLFQCSPTLVILTPHKRPALEELEGVELSHVDYALTAKGKKVFLKIYKLSYNM